MKGYIQVYTGNGKGKTTAAIRLALRAAGAGKKVFIAQFIKGKHYSELDILNCIPNIELKQYGSGCFIYSVPKKEDIEVAIRGLYECEIILKNGEFDVVILDEANIALYYNLFSLDEFKRVIVEKLNILN